MGGDDDNNSPGGGQYANGGGESGGGVPRQQTLDMVQNHIKKLQEMMDSDDVAGNILGRNLESIRTSDGFGGRRR